MMFYNRGLVFIVCLLSLIFQVRAQDPIFSQFFHAPLTVNAAMAGYRESPSFDINYRHQWPDISNAYRTASISYDQFFHRTNSGIGLHLLYDNAGDGIIRTFKIGGIYTYRVRLGDESYLKGAIEASAIQRAPDEDKYIFLDQLDPRYGLVTPGGTPLASEEDLSEVQNHWYPSIGFSVLGYGNTFYGGVSLKNLNRPGKGILTGSEVKEARIQVRYTLLAGAEFESPMTVGGTPARIAPQLLFVNQGQTGQIIGGSYAGIGPVFAGLFYRHAWDTPDALIIVGGIKYDMYRIGYSYDVSLGPLAEISGGSHELSFNINLERIIKDRKSRYIDCFDFFR